VATLDSRNAHGSGGLLTKTLAEFDQFATSCGSSSAANSTSSALNCEDRPPCSCEAWHDLDDFLASFQSLACFETSNPRRLVDS